jgi:hypothetical protein
MMLFYSFSEILIDKVDFPNNFSKFCNAMSWSWFLKSN